MWHTEPFAFEMHKWPCFFFFLVKAHDIRLLFESLSRLARWPLEVAKEELVCNQIMRLMIAEMNRQTGRVEWQEARIKHRCRQAHL